MSEDYVDLAGDYPEVQSGTKIVHTFAFGTVCHSLTVWNGWLLAATSDGIWIQRKSDEPFERYVDIEPYMEVRKR